MLVLSRKKNEMVHIGRLSTVTVTEIRGDKVRLAFDSPRDIGVHRGEIVVAMAARGEAVADAAADSLSFVHQSSIHIRRLLSIARQSTPRRDAWDELDEIERWHETFLSPESWPLTPAAK